MIWGFAFVAQRVGSDHISALSFNGIRFMLGALSLLPLMLTKERYAVTKENRGATVCSSLVLGVVLWAASFMQQKGIEITGSASKAGFITGLYIVLVPIVGGLLFKKRTGICVWLGAVSAVIGLYLLSMTGSEVFGLGDILYLASTLFWTVHILLVDRFTKNGISPIFLSFGQFFVCSILNLALVPFFEVITPSGVISALIPLLYGGILSVGVAYTLQVVAQKNADPAAAAIIMSMESVFSCVGAVLILHERMAVSNYIGCVFMLIGIVLAQLPQKEKV